MPSPASTAPPPAIFQCTGRLTAMSVACIGGNLVGYHISADGDATQSILRCGVLLTCLACIVLYPLLGRGMALFFAIAGYGSLHVTENAIGMISWQSAWYAAFRVLHLARINNVPGALAAMSTAALTDLTKAVPVTRKESRRHTVRAIKVLVVNSSVVACILVASKFLHAHLKQEIVATEAYAGKGQGLPPFLQSTCMALVVCHALKCLDGVYPLVMLPFGVLPSDTFHDPLTSTASLRDFWGRAWNSSIEQLFRVTLFRPVYRWSGSYVAASFVVFATSGVLHAVGFVLGSMTHRDGMEVVAFFMVQWALLVVEATCLPAALRCRAWVLGSLATTAPLIALPLARLYNVYP